MSEITRIQDQLRRAYRGPAWHGPSLREVLEGVGAEAAAARPLPEAHSIWEIVLHVAGWQDVVRRRLGGEKVREPDPGDWPAQGSGEEAWREALEALDRSHAALLEAVGRVDPARLDELLFRGAEWSVYVSLHGVVQHNLYHAGQIALLKKG